MTIAKLILLVMATITQIIIIITIKIITGSHSLSALQQYIISFYFTIMGLYYYLFYYCCYQLYYFLIINLIISNIKIINIININIITTAFSHSHHTDHPTLPPTLFYSTKPFNNHPAFTTPTLR